MLGEEHRLIARILFDGDFSVCERQRITKEMFRNLEARQAFEYLREYTNTTETLGFIPSIDIFKQRFPGFPIYEEPEPLPVLCAAVKGIYIDKKVDSVAVEIKKTKGTKSLERLAYVKDLLDKLDSEFIDENDTLDAADSGDIVLEALKKLEDSHGMLGIPWPWPKINWNTHGIQPGNWIILYGRPKSGKTTLAVGVCASIFSGYNKRIGLFNFEDVKEDLMLLFYCYLAGADYLSAKKGIGNAIDKENIRKVIEQVKQLKSEKGRLFIVEDCRRPNLTYIAKRIRELRLDVVILNGVYFLAPSDPESQTNLSRAVKQMAKEEKCAIIGVHQANQFHGRAAYSDAFNQDCDAMIKVEPHIFNDRTTGSKLELQLVRGGGSATEVLIESKPGVTLAEREDVMPQEEAEEIPKYAAKSKRVSSE
jgi:hypothetical protein